MPLPEAGIVLFDLLRLLRRQFDTLLQVPLLHLHPAVVHAGHSVADQDLLHRWKTDRHTLDLQGIRQFHAPPRRLLQTRLQNFRFCLRRCGVRLALDDRRQILQPLQTVCLETAFQLVETRSVHPASTARF